MKQILLLSFFLIGAIALSACSSGSRIGDGPAGADSTLAYTNAVHVLVDGRDVGTIPQTIRVRRSFGTRVISLYQRGEVIREYEIPISPTTEGEQTRMGFYRTSSPDGETYDIRNLPKKDKTYTVPYSSGPMRVDDNEYGVTLLIRE